MSLVGAYPFTLTNGAVADATQVMADFNQVRNDVNSNAATNGANSNITSLSGLTTPLSLAQGGTPVYIGGTSTGSANAQVVATLSPTTFTLTQGFIATFVAGFANSGATTLNVNSTGIKNVFKQTATGPVALTGNEIQVGDAVAVQYDGTQYQIISSTFFSGGTLTATTTMSGAAFNEAFATIAAAATTNIGAAAANYLQVTGNTGITAFDTIQAGVERTLEFSGTPTITHNAVSLILMDSVTITASAGLVLKFRSEGAGNWRQVSTNSYAIPTVIVQDRKATTTAGAALTQNVYTDHDLNTLILNTVGGVTAVSTPNLTLPAGTYDVTAFAVITFGTGGLAKMRLFNTTDAAVQTDINANDIVNLNSGTSAGVALNNTPIYPLRARFTIAAQKNLKFQVWNSQAGGTAGSPQNGTGNTEPEVYLSAEFVKVA